MSSSLKVWSTELPPVKCILKKLPDKYFAKINLQAVRGAADTDADIDAFTTHSVLQQVTDHTELPITEK